MSSVYQLSENSWFSKLEKPLSKPLFRLSFWIFLIIAQVLLHWNVWNKDLIGMHVWRQTETQTVADLFYYQNPNILQPQKYHLHEGEQATRREFPIFQYGLSKLYVITGRSVTVTRIVCFVLMFFSAAGLYHLFYLWKKNHLISVAGAWLFLCSPVVFYYMVSPLPDTLALCTSVWSITLSYKYLKTGNKWHLTAAFAMAGLATAVKLPFIFVYAVPGLLAVFTLQKDSIIKVSTLILSIVPAAAWYSNVIPEWGNSALLSGITGNKNDLGTTFKNLTGNFLSIIPENLLNYAALPLFAAGLLFIFKQRPAFGRFFKILLIYTLLVVAYIIYEINVITTRHDYYLFPLLPVLVCISVYGVWHLLISNKKFAFVLLILCFASAPITMMLRMHHRWNIENPGFNPNLYKYHHEITSVIPENGRIIAGNDESLHIWLYYLKRRGFNFSNETISLQEYQQYRAAGAGFLISDSRAVENITFIAKDLEKLLLEKGDIRVYKLREPAKNQ